MTFDRTEFALLLRFCLVGATNTVVTLAAYAGLTALGVDAAIAAALAFGVGAVNSFQLNRRWTFSDLPSSGDAWLRFATIQGAGALISGGGVAVLQDAGWGHLTAECAILPFVTAVVYCLVRTLVFRSAAVACER